MSQSYVDVLRFGFGFGFDLEIAVSIIHENRRILTLT